MSQLTNLIDRDPECEKCSMGIPMAAYGCVEHPNTTKHPTDCTCEGKGYVFNCDLCNPPESFKTYVPDGQEWWD